MGCRNGGGAFTNVGWSNGVATGNGSGCTSGIDGALGCGGCDGGRVCSAGCGINVTKLGSVLMVADGSASGGASSGGGGTRAVEICPSWRAVFSAVSVLLRAMR